MKNNFRRAVTTGGLAQSTRGQPMVRGSQERLKHPIKYLAFAFSHSETIVSQSVQKQVERCRYVENVSPLKQFQSERYFLSVPFPVRQVSF